MDRAADHRILPMDEAPTHLIRDRDARYGQAVTRRLAAIGIRDRPTAPRVPGSHRDLQRGPFASSPQGLMLPTTTMFGRIWRWPRMSPWFLPADQSPGA